ncbi:MAG TPA: TraR/DksA C4-type zinc finger protein [Anaerolineae bacterium]|nr:TraR/DksA C4-type zinc finger protein [Anaerolineae bacterium]HOQ99705.1 TraR/DksA C4-type zinc finger protein [Anaerolineae bacterium]HPL26624.1 TraR/DksA C4-type zinc finger protein [Anaerolineae bacterium]
MANEQDRLEKERQRTEEEIARLRSYLETELERSTGEDDDAVDTAADIYEREKTLALIRTLEDKLASIEHALHSSITGRYGICERCGTEIEPGRLEIMPHATLCVRCQAETERRVRRTRVAADE